MLNWVSVSAVTQHIEAPTKAKRYPYWITKAGFVVKINFFAPGLQFKTGLSPPADWPTALGGPIYVLVL